MIEKLNASDVIALIVVIGYIALTLVGLQSELSPALLLIIGFYFGAKHEQQK